MSLSWLFAHKSQTKNHSISVLPTNLSIHKDHNSDKDVEVYTYEDFIGSNQTENNVSKKKEHEGSPHDILNNMIGQTITGKILNSIMEGIPFLKFMHDDDQHYGMKYVTGRNHDIEPFINSGQCEKGGIYFVTIGHFNEYYRLFGSLSKEKYARRVRIDDDALIYIERNKLKCNKIILEDRMKKKVLVKKLITETLRNGHPEVIHQIIEIDGRSIKYIDQKIMTHDMMIHGVKRDGLSIRYIDQNNKNIDEIIMEAVKQNGMSLQYIDPKLIIDQIRMEAIKNHSMAVQFIDPINVTRSMIECALTAYPFVIGFMDQKLLTPSIIMFAIEQKCCCLFQIDESMRTNEMIDMAITQCRKNRCSYCNFRFVPKIQF